MTKTLSLLLTALLALACGGEHHAGHSDEHAAAAPTHAVDEQAEELRLNDGEKWEMDEHTRSMFRLMVERVEEWEPDAAAPESLAVALQADLDSLIRGCTMTGEAHAELHKYLMHLMPAIDDLAREAGEPGVRAVADVLDMYPRYFD